jgi:DNA-binding MarR family transcriptional regulator
MSLAPVLLDQIFHLTSALKHYQRDGIFCEDLSFGQYRILRFIADNQAITMGGLVEDLGVEKKHRYPSGRPPLGIWVPD